MKRRTRTFCSNIENVAYTQTHHLCLHTLYTCMWNAYCYCKLNPNKITMYSVISYMPNAYLSYVEGVVLYIHTYNIHSHFVYICTWRNNLPTTNITATSTTLNSKYDQICERICKMVSHTHIYILVQRQRVPRQRWVDLLQSSDRQPGAGLNISKWLQGKCM